MLRTATATGRRFERVKEIDVHYKNTVLYLGFKSATTYTLSELEREIRSSNSLQGVISPDQELKMSYDNQQGLRVRRMGIPTNESLHHAMKVTPGLTLKIYLEAIFPLKAVTTRILELERKISALQSEMIQMKSTMEKLIACVENPKHKA